MAVVIAGEALTDAWLTAMEHLRSQGNEQLNLVTEIADPDPARTNAGIVAELDAVLARKGKQRVATVANTIFPAAFLAGCLDRQQLYNRSLAVLPRLRKQHGNAQRTYFARMISYAVGANGKSAEPVN